VLCEIVFFRAVHRIKPNKNIDNLSEVEKTTNIAGHMLKCWYPSFRTR